MDYVIGSGLSGVMCARALLEKGRQVTMLDVGVLPSKETSDVKQHLSERDPHAWDKQTLSSVSGTLSQTKGRVPSRLYFNSYYMYADTVLEGIDQQKTNCRMSYAQGGLGVVWGGATLPAQKEDFNEWPFSIDRMRFHYEAVAKEIGIAGVRDNLETMFPFFGNPLPVDDLSQQAEHICKNLTAHRQSLSKSGITYGRSRLAYRSSSLIPGCKKCALCLSGCPFDVIYSATDTLRKLKKRKEFTYIEDCIVKRIEEKENIVYLHTVHSGKEKVFEGDRVFVACGPLGTLKLMSDSRVQSRDTYALHYQPYFMLPLLSLKNLNTVSREKVHTMAQLFIELHDQAISDRTIHMQLYTYSPQIQSEIDRMFGRIPFLKKAVDYFITGRLLLIQGYVHASAAPAISVEKEVGKLRLHGVDERSVKVLIRQVARKLFGLSLQIGAIPLLPMLKYGLPGDGNHAGASFPMAETPTENQTDVYGRLPEFSRVHMVDSSVLSTIPAPTISYTVMANAHRIGWESVELNNELI